MFGRKTVRVGIAPLAAGAARGAEAPAPAASAADPPAQRPRGAWTGSDAQQRPMHSGPPAHAQRAVATLAPAASSAVEAAHAVGCSVQVRFNGGAMWYPAEVMKAHPDGTIDVLYTNGAEESGVAPDFVKSSAAVLQREQQAADATAARQSAYSVGDAPALAQRRPVAARRVAPLGKRPAGAADVAASGTLIWHGSYLWKIPYTKGSVPKLRWFKVLPASHNDGPILQWSNPRSTKNNKPREVLLDDVRELKLGHESTAFARQISKRGVESLPPEAFCFSLVTRDRTVDVGAQNEQEAQEWIRSLRILTRVPVAPLPMGAALQHSAVGGAGVSAASSDPRAAYDPRMQAPDGRSDGAAAEEKLRFWRHELFAACRSGQLDVVQQLLDDGCPIDLMDPSSAVADTPLLLACRTNNTALIDLCLNRGAKFDPHPNFGETALQIAVSNRQLAAAQLLLRTAQESDADRFIVNLEDHNKDAPLHVAARNADLDGVELLLHHQADFRLLNGRGRTPLHSGAMHGAQRVVARLLEVGSIVVIDLQDYDGFTPLHCAAQCGSPPIVRVLLQAGANCLLTTLGGLSPSAVAQEHSHSITAAVLEEHAQKDYDRRCVEESAVQQQQQQQQMIMQQQQHAAYQQQQAQAQQAQAQAQHAYQQQMQQMQAAQQQQHPAMHPAMQQMQQAGGHYAYAAPQSGTRYGGVHVETPRLFNHLEVHAGVHPGVAAPQTPRLFDHLEVHPPQQVPYHAAPAYGEAEYAGAAYDETYQQHEYAEEAYGEHATYGGGVEDLEGEEVVDQWQILFDEQGYQYFYNATTGLSQWEDPRDTLEEVAEDGTDVAAEEMDAYGESHHDEAASAAAHGEEPPPAGGEVQTTYETARRAPRNGHRMVEVPEGHRVVVVPEGHRVVAAGAESDVVAADAAADGALRTPPSSPLPHQKFRPSPVTIPKVGPASAGKASSKEQWKTPRSRGTPGHSRRTSPTGSVTGSLNGESPSSQLPTPPKSKPPSSKEATPTSRQQIKSFALKSPANDSDRRRGSRSPSFTTDAAERKRRGSPSFMRPGIEMFNANAASTSVSASASAVAGAAAPPVSSTETMHMQKYVRMRRAGVSEGGIREKMSMELIAQVDIDAFFAKAAMEKRNARSSSGPSQIGSAPPFGAISPCASAQSGLDAAPQLLTTTTSPSVPRHPVAMPDCGEPSTSAPATSLPPMGGMPAMPAMPAMPGGMPGGMPAMPAMGMPAMPAMPAMGMPAMPAMGMPAMPAMGMPGMPTGMPGMPTGMAGMPGMPGAGGGATPANKPANKKPATLRLHWKPLSADKFDSSIWATPAMSRGAQSTLDDDDIKELQELFAQKVKAQGTSGKKKGRRRSSVKKRRSSTTGGKGKAGGGAVLNDGPIFIEGKRGHNLCIGLAQFRRYHDDFSVLVSDVLARKLTPDALSTLSELLPTAREVRSMRNIRKLKPAKLVLPEKFIYAVASVPDMEAKIQALNFCNAYPEKLERLQKRTTLLSEACDQILDSSDLMLVMETVLAIGNAMNDGTRTGSAAGFSLESLLKLTETRSKVKGVTVLDHMMKVLSTKKGFKLEEFPEQLAKTKAAKRILVPDLVVSHRETTKAMAALMVEANSDSSSTVGAASAASADSAASAQLVEFRAYLSTFGASCDADMAALRIQLDEMFAKCEELAKYFGEEPKPESATRIFDILDKFLGSYIRAVETMKRKQRAAARDARTSKRRPSTSRKRK